MRAFDIARNYCKYLFIYLFNYLFIYLFIYFNWDSPLKAFIGHTMRMELEEKEKQNNEKHTWIWLKRAQG